MRFADAESAFRALLAVGVVVRDQRAAPQLDNALRITIEMCIRDRRLREVNT